MAPLPPSHWHDPPRPLTIYSHSEFFSRPLQYFDPAIQASVRLLGIGRLPLALKLILKAGIPSVDVRRGDWTQSMALPGFIEILRQEFAGRVTVL